MFSSYLKLLVFCFRALVFYVGFMISFLHVNTHKICQICKQLFLDFASCHLGFYYFVLQRRVLDHILYMQPIIWLSGYFYFAISLQPWLHIRILYRNIDGCILLWLRVMSFVRILK